MYLSVKTPGEWISAIVIPGYKKVIVNIRTITEG
jgi:hypothetical protein